MSALERLRIYPVLAELKACLCARVAQMEDTPNQLCLCGIIMGEDIPVEYAGNCDEIGAAYVRVGSAFPAINFPNADEQPTMPTVLAYQVTVGILRGAPYGEGLEPPAPELVEEYTLALLEDHQVLWETINCCLGDDKFDDLQFLLGTYTPMAISGGIGGGEWSLLIQEPLR